MLACSGPLEAPQSRAPGLKPMPGRLVIVATPIGNLEDLSARARRALEEADLVACEDTRHTGRLLSALGIRTPMLSLHEHNEERRLPRLMATLESGGTVAMASDAGTPLLSDPGFPLVREAIRRGIRVEPIPGPSAILAALVASGLPPYPFTFVGFPPPKAGRKRRFLERFRTLDHTLVLYESPHRILTTLEAAEEVLGDRPAAIGRELTKLHEEILRGPLSELRHELADRPKLKGEFVLVVGGA